MKIKYRLLSLSLALVLCLGLSPVAYAIRTDCRYRVVAGGVSHSLAVKEDGSVWAWGSNSDKQAAPNYSNQSFTRPTKVGGVASAVAVAAGSNFSAALLADGSVTVWGGESGFSKVPGLTGVSSISAGQSSLLALKHDGTVWQWLFGSSAPEQVPGLGDISAVSAGGGHYLALSRSGQVWAWGSNHSGQLGVGSSESRIDTPRKVAGLSDIISIAAGYSHSLAVDHNGRVYAWGANGSGQLGNGTTVNSSTPQAVMTVERAVQVSAGNETSMALTADSRVYTWGYGEYGQLGSAGSNTANFRARPETIDGGALGTPILIASGMNHHLLVNNWGTVFTWGRNRDGQLGTGENVNGTTPKNTGLSLTGGDKYALDWYDTDVPAEMSAWAVSDLTALHDTGLTPPSAWERYKQNITRAEFAHLVVTVYEQWDKKQANASTEARFQDIGGHPLEQSILKAFQLGLLQGRSETVFAPNSNMTRQEAAKLLCTLVEKMEGERIPPEVGRLSYYSDAAQIAEWAVPYVSFAHDQEIMQGSGGRFDPTGYTTREQALAIVARLVEHYGWE